MPNQTELKLDRENDIKEMTAEVVTAYLSNNQMASGDLPSLIADVFNTFDGLSGSKRTKTAAKPKNGRKAKAKPKNGRKAKAKPQPKLASKTKTIADTGRLTPAVPVKSSVTNELIYCLECGEGFKTIKRHLMSSHKLTPDKYRKKWGLPVDYPMVAPNYSKKRSTTAKKLGLGRKRKRS